MYVILIRKENFYRINNYVERNNPPIVIMKKGRGSVRTEAMHGLHPSIHVSLLVN